MTGPAPSSVSFDLRIEATGGAGRYCAIAELGDSAVARHVFDWPEGDGSRRPPPLLSGAGRAVRRREVVAAVEQARAWGDLLFRQALGGSVLSHFQEARRRARQAGLGFRLRLWLTGAPCLACLPWELLFDVSRRQFLLKDLNLSLVRSLDVPEPPGHLRVELPLRVLVVIASPADRDRLDFEEEYRRIEDELGGLRRSGKVFLDRLWPATCEALASRLRESPWHVLHYIGHGGHGRRSPEGSLVLEDEVRRSDVLDGSEVADLVGAHPSLRLVVLNACRGGQAGEADASTGVGQTLLLRGMPAVVAMQSDIGEAAALALAGHFYRGLADTGSVDRALAQARGGLPARRYGLAWAAPVLLTLSPDGRIFDVAEAVDPERDDDDEDKEEASRRRRRGRRLAAASALASVALVAALLVANVLSRAMPGKVQGPWSLGWMLGFDPAPPPWKRPQPVRTDDERCPPPPGVDLHFVLIPPGTFLMGSDKGIEEARPAHEVTITHPFCLAVFETTQDQWRTVMGERSNRSPVRGGDFPVTRVTWTEAQGFARRLDAGNPAAPFRLPTEAESEYAAREGASAYTEPAPEGSPRHANCLGTAPGDPWGDVMPVGQLAPNAFGLFDMVGNVWEWVEDGYASFSQGAETNPRREDAGKGRVRRGGTFNSAEVKCTALTRGSAKPGRRSLDTGFRIARDPVPVAAQ